MTSVQTLAGYSDMLIRELKIKSFRCIKELTVKLGDTTVLIGENNTGKSALLDAVKLALQRRFSRKQSNFSEFDFCLADAGADPRTASPIQIEITFSENSPDEWPPEIMQALDPVVQTDPLTDLDSVFLRCSCEYDQSTRQFETRYDFLQHDGTPLRQAETRQRLGALLTLFPLFYLSALRDAADEFSSSSQFWGKMLRAANIPEDVRNRLEQELEALNSNLLQADPNVAKIADTIGLLRNVFGDNQSSSVQIRALPLKTWDLMSRSEVILRRKEKEPWFPLGRHGQGVQSLAVIFLFRAFVEHLLATSYDPNSTPILAIEEPEAHLHPQAARALWAQVSSLKGQKLVSTHSPYFMQHVPFRDLRILRRRDGATNVFFLDTEFRESIPTNPALQQLCNTKPSLLRYDTLKRELVALSQIDPKLYRDLLMCFTSPAERMTIHPRLRALADRSQLYISDSILASLEGYARRIRGEIFFARAWLLCEGQSDFIMLHRFAEMLDFPLDVNGVSVIDYQNNGSPSAFVRLARALGFSWFMVCDNDQGGNDQIAQVKRCGLSLAELAQRVHQLPLGDLELFLLQNGFRQELLDIAKASDGTLSDASTDPEISSVLQRDKDQSASALAQKLLIAKAPATRVPAFIQAILNKLKEAVQQ